MLKGVNKKIVITGFPKITLLFIILIASVLGNIFLSDYLINRNKENIETITNRIFPIVNSIKEFRELVTESKMYATNWIFLQNNNNDKSKLLMIHHVYYPALKNKLKKQIYLNYNTPNDLIFNRDSIENLFSSFENIISVEKEIINTLKKFSDYENPAKRFYCEELLETEIIAKSDYLLNDIRLLTVELNKNRNSIIEKSKQNFELVSNFLIVTSIAFFIFILTSIYLISTGIKNPVLKMKRVIAKLSRGELPKEKLKVQDNIIGEMVDSLNRLSENFAKTAEFADSIGSGKLNTKYYRNSEKDILGNALINMRDSLKAYADNMEKQIDERTAEVFEKSKKIEEQKVFYESVLSQIPIEISILDENNDYIFINHVNNLNETSIQISEIEKRKEVFEKVLNTGISIEYEENLILNNDEKIISRTFYPISENNRFKYIISYGIDITNQRQNELKIKESLEEKEALLGEIHHRVKNNLTLVLGLIEMQKEKETEEHIKNSFIEIRNRIYAMSLIHDKMYKSQSFAKIDTSDYMNELVYSIASFYNKNNNVKINLQIEHILIKSAELVPVALLLNEIITNSFKYAFKDAHRKGELSISLAKQQEDVLLLKISDNGNGLPEGIDLKKSKSLGFKLLSIFVKQIKGEYKFYSDNGLHFEIKWKLNE